MNGLYGPLAIEKRVVDFDTHQVNWLWNPSRRLPLRNLPYADFGRPREAEQLAEGLSDVGPLQ